MHMRPRILHLLDDLAMGGVTRALKNFEHPMLQEYGRHKVMEIGSKPPQAELPTDIAIIHFTMNWRKLPWLVQLKRCGGFQKIILIEHTYTEGFEQNEVPNLSRFRYMLRSAYRFVDTVVAISSAQKDWMVSARLLRPEKVVTIAQSRDCRHLFKIPAARRCSGPLKIGAFGRFHRQKGFDLLLEAIAKVSPELVQLQLAGMGEGAERLRQLSQALPHAEIIDPFSSPDDFLTSIDCVAIPSRWEAFGLVGTEARAAGRPIIVSSVDGLKDQAGQHAFVHKPGDIDDIVRAILEAVTAPDINMRARVARSVCAREYDIMLRNWAALLFQSNYLKAVA